MTTKKFIKIDIENEDTLKRLDIFLSEYLTTFSRNRIQQLIKNEDEGVFVNEKKEKPSYKLKLNDSITILMPEVKDLELKPENLNLDIVYENEDLLVVNKPFNMLTHPTSRENTGTLVNGLLYHCKDNLSGINGILRPGIVHRLDRDTSGLLMVAKNDFAHNALAEQIKTKTAKRCYRTIVIGNIKEDSGTIDLPIVRSKTDRLKMAVTKEEDGKSAITHYKVLERFQNYTYLEVQLQTGRTHQIRVHFSYNKHPVYGDPLYGGNNAKVKTHGQVLQSYKLTFINPADNKLLSFEIPPDEDVQKVLKYLRNLQQ